MRSLEERLAETQRYTRIVETRMRGKFVGKFVGTDEWLSCMYLGKYGEAVEACEDAVLYWEDSAMRITWLNRHMLSESAAAGDFVPFKAYMEDSSDLHDGGRIRQLTSGPGLSTRVAGGGNYEQETGSALHGRRTVCAELLLGGAVQREREAAGDG